MPNLIFLAPEARPPFRAPIEVRLPSGEGQQFIALMRELPTAKFKRVAIDAGDDIKLLEAALVGWEGITDAAGKEVPFNAANRDVIIDWTAVRVALVRAYVRAVSGANDSEN